MFFESALIILAAVIGGCLGGALLGLIPFFLGKYSGKPNLGKLGFNWSMGLGASVIGSPFVFAVVIGFVIAILVKESDYYPANQVIQPNGYVAPVSPAPAPVASTRMGVTCLAGPMKGQTYGVGPQGMIIGRDHDCGIRFPSAQPGVSRHHCSLRWEGGVLMLSDMNSSNGTFLADGRKLPPQYPTQVAAGSRFYLGSTANLFQIVITG